MHFINSVIDPSELPALETVPLQKIGHRYLKVLRLEWLITALIFAAIATVLILLINNLRETNGWMVVAGSALFMIVIHRLLLEKNFSHLAYAVREKDMLSQKGWITRSIKACPFNRIQNCSVQSGPLERKYKLASLVIYTAGSDSADMRISGLSQDEAERLRHFILEKIHSEAHEGI